MRRCYVSAKSTSCVHAAQHVEEMDSAKFVKLCRDSKLLSKAVTTTDVDLFFTKAGGGLPLVA